MCKLDSMLQSQCRVRFCDHKLRVLSKKNIGTRRIKAYESIDSTIQRRWRRFAAKNCFLTFPDRKSEGCCKTHRMAKPRIKATTYIKAACRQSQTPIGML